MKLNDAILGWSSRLGAAVLIAIQGYPKIPGQPVGPALFPGLIAAGLCIGGVLLVARGWMERAGQPWVVWDDWVRSPRHVLALAVLLGAILFYILVSEWLGFLPTAVLILLALFLVLRRAAHARRAHRRHRHLRHPLRLLQAAARAAALGRAQGSRLVSTSLP
jgi:putative tricarboxylic transport membrane protein